jgi:hypothetical protein
MEILQQIGSSGIPGVIVALVTTIIGVIYAVNNAKLKVEELTKNAYEQTIKAQKEYNDILDTRLKDIEKENARLSYTLTAILDVLKSREIYITVQGHLITIREGKEMTAIRVSDEEKG